MTRKKTIEAVSVSSPKTSASVPVEKKSRAKSVTATKAAPEKAELVSKPVHNRRVSAEVKAVAAPTAKKPVSKLAEAVELSQEDIAIRAYLNWLDRGCPHGTSGEDWFRAESQLRAKPKAAAAGA